MVHVRIRTGLVEHGVVLMLYSTIIMAAQCCKAANNALQLVTIKVHEQQ
jgi:hypothetical protein